MEKCGCLLVLALVVMYIFGRPASDGQKTDFLSCLTFLYSKLECRILPLLETVQPHKLYILAAI